MSQHDTLTKLHGVLALLGACLCAIVVVAVLAGCSSSQGNSTSASSVSSSSSSSTYVDDASGETEELSLSSAASKLSVVDPGEGVEDEANLGESGSLQSDSGKTIGTLESGAASSASKPSSYSMDSRFLDEYGNVTLYAFSELTGSQLQRMATDNGYKHQSTNAYSRGSRNYFACMLEGKALAPSDVVQLEKGAEGEPVIFVIQETKYPTAKDALQGLAPMTIEKSAFTSDGKFGVAIVSGASSQQFAVIIMKNDGGGFGINAYNAEAVTSGFAAKHLGGNFSTFDGFWAMVTG